MKSNYGYVFYISLVEVLFEHWQLTKEPLDLKLTLGIGDIHAIMSHIIDKFKKHSIGDDIIKAELYIDPEMGNESCITNGIHTLLTFKFDF